MANFVWFDSRMQELQNHLSTTGIWEKYMVETLSVAYSEELTLRANWQMCFPNSNTVLKSNATDAIWVIADLHMHYTSDEWSQVSKGYQQISLLQQGLNNYLPLVTINAIVIVVVNYQIGSARTTWIAYVTLIHYCSGHWSQCRPCDLEVPGLTSSHSMNWGPITRFIPQVNSMYKVTFNGMKKEHA